MEIRRALLGARSFFFLTHHRTETKASDPWGHALLSRTALSMVLETPVNPWGSELGACKAMEFGTGSESFSTSHGE